MKNQRLERTYRLMRQYHRNRRGDPFEQGIRVRRDDIDDEPDARSWRDDVTFILGGRRVKIAWQHPRCAYQGMIQDAAEANLGI
jgi:hypothetical protein